MVCRNSILFEDAGLHIIFFHLPAAGSCVMGTTSTTSANDYARYWYQQYDSCCEGYHC